MGRATNGPGRPLFFLLRVHGQLFCPHPGVDDPRRQSPERLRFCIVRSRRRQSWPQIVCFFFSLNVLSDPMLAPASCGEQFPLPQFASCLKGIFVWPESEISFW